jgi:hypothetical protein
LAGAPSAPKAAAPAKATLVTNVQPNAGLQARFQKVSQPLRDLVRGQADAQPKADDGSTVLCLSYALRGSCNSQCRRQATHRGLSPAEVTRVGAFLTLVGCE